MSQWYCVVAGKQHGPIAEEVLCQWAQQGRVGPGDLVWTEGMAEWVPAGTVAALLTAFPPVAGPPAGLRPNRGGAVLALGILGLLTCFVLGIIAWVMGKSDLREMDAGRMDPSGRGTTQAGKILGMIATILYLAVIAVWLVIVVIAAITAACMSC
ncbi:MAG: DUF4339 domain-containing protein [Phycisphaerae bacterium]|nr:DUF4339 domain-containing protein [Phycisphaerae bacterium]